VHAFNFPVFLAVFFVQSYIIHCITICAVLCGIDSLSGITSLEQEFTRKLADIDKNRYARNFHFELKDRKVV